MSKTTGFVCVVMATCALTCQATTIYTNLDAANGFDTQNGSIIDGGSYANQVIADAFTPAQDGILSEVDIAAGVVQGLNTLDLFLASDALGMPGTVLVSLQQQTPLDTFQPGNLIRYTCASCPLLTTHTQYWLVAQQTDFNTISVWNWNAINQYGSGSDLAFNQNGSAIGPWTADSTDLRNAFAVLGNAPAAVPECGSAGLTGGGLLLLTGYLQKRKKSPLQKTTQETSCH